MASSRAQLVVLLDSNVKSGNSDTTAAGLRTYENEIIISCLNKNDDLNQNGGYLGIASGRVDITFINKAVPSGQFLRDDGTWASAATSTSDLLSVLTVGNTTSGVSILISTGDRLDAATLNAAFNIGTTNAGTTTIGTAAKILSLPSTTIAIGKITSGAWQGTAIGPTFGGTGMTSYTRGDIVYASNTNVLGALADVSIGSYLRSGGVGAVPVWSTLKLPNAAAAIGSVPYTSATDTISMAGASGFASDGTMVSVGASIASLPISNNYNESTGGYNHRNAGSGAKAFYAETSTSAAGLVAYEGMVISGAVIRSTVYGTTGSGNYTGTSVAKASTSNLDSGTYVSHVSTYSTSPLVLSGSLVYCTSGTTSTNIGWFLSTAGMRVDLLSNIHTAPTAKLHIGGGTTSAGTASTKYDTGTLMTTAEVGAREYNGAFYETNGSPLRYGIGGIIANFTSTVDNATTVETDLYTYTTKVRTLNSVGEAIEAIYSGVFNDLTATSQLRVYFAGTSIADTGALTVSATGGWQCNVFIIRTDTDKARAVVTINTPGASTALYTSQTDLTGLTFTNTNIIKITGQAGGATGGSSDIQAKLGEIWWWPAANN